MYHTHTCTCTWYFFASIHLTGAGVLVGGGGGATGGGGGAGGGKITSQYMTSSHTCQQNLRYVHV